MSGRPSLLSVISALASVTILTLVAWNFYLTHLLPPQPDIRLFWGTSFGTPYNSPDQKDHIADIPTTLGNYRLNLTLTIYNAGDGIAGNLWANAARVPGNLSDFHRGWVCRGLPCELVINAIPRSNAPVADLQPGETFSVIWEIEFFVDELKAFVEQGETQTVELLVEWGPDLQTRESILVQIQLL